MATIYADNTLGANCLGTYNPTTRVCGTGADIAYNTVNGAIARPLVAGDILEIRSGNYQAEGTINLDGCGNGSAGNVITIRGFMNTEIPTLRRMEGTNKKFFSFSSFTLDTPANVNGAFRLLHSLAANSTTNITIDSVSMLNCTGAVINFSPNAVAAIDGICHDITITNCTLVHVGAIANDNISFNAGGYNIIIEDNIITGAGEQHIDIKWLFHDISIQRNTFTNAPSGAILINPQPGGSPGPNPCYNIEIAYNSMTNCGTDGGTQNGGIANTIGSATSGTYLIHHNLIVPSTANPRDGILLRNFGTVNVGVYNNTVVGAVSGIATQAGVTATIKNNTSSGSSGQAFLAANSPTEDYNNWFPTGGNLVSYAGTAYTSLATYRTATGQGVHSQSNSPNFDNTTTYDLAQGSPLIDTGVVIPGITDGYFGSAPDLGWREVGIPPVTISAVTIAPADIHPTQVTITWTTNVGANSQVDYGLTSSYDLSSPLSTASVTSHSVTLTGLTPYTLYHFQAKSGGSVSGDFTFRTLIPAPTGVVIS